MKLYLNIPEQSKTDPLLWAQESTWAENKAEYKGLFTSMDFPLAYPVPSGDAGSERQEAQLS